MLWLVAVVFMVASAWVFTRLLERRRTWQALMLTLILMKVWAVFLMALGLDRPVLIIETRFGATTITAMQLLLASSFAATLWVYANRERLEEVLG